jgi:hypothetical protein
MSQQEWDAYATDPALIYSPPKEETVEVPLEIDFVEPEAREAGRGANTAAQREAADRAVAEKIARLGGGS